MVCAHTWETVIIPVCFFSGILHSKHVREVQQHGDYLGQEADVLKVALAKLHEQHEKLHIERRLCLQGNNNKQPDESQLIILKK